MMERREVLKRMWVAPAILTLPVLPSMARAGSDVPSEGGPVSSWTVTATAFFDPSNPAPPQLFAQGTYQILPGGQVYLLSTNWMYQGQYGAVDLPLGFPAITLGPTPVMVVPNL